MNPRWRGARFWLRILAANLFVAVLIVLAFADVAPRQWIGHWRAFGTSVATSFLFAMCIGPLVGVTMPRLAPWVWRRLRAPFNWCALVAAMIVCALVGSAIAIAVLVAFGLPASLFWQWYLGSMRVSIVVTLTIGIFITAYEMNQSRLAQANTQAKLASLESRVQPHFLFNTLNSIAALTHEDPGGAEKMTTQLAALLRSSLDGDRSPIVRLGDELELVRSYLEIERVRFGDRLRFSIDADGAPADAGVPRMSVQTLVENSVKYAVSPRRAGGTVAVRAAQVGGRLRIAVQDDGPGFDGAHVPEGHGLALLRDRLAAQFGGVASLRIDGTPGAAVATIEVPLRPLGGGQRPCQP